MFDSMQINADKNTKYNFAYLIDVSDSVEKKTLQQAKDAYTSLTKSLIDRGIAGVSQFAVIPFSSDAILNAPLSATEAISTVKGLSGNGFTNFNAALEKANQFFSTVPPGATNIAYFLSDGFLTTGGSFKDSAKALQAVADVRAYGFGAANIQSLEIVDSDEPVIVSEASELKTKFNDSINNLVASNSQIDSTTDENNDVEIASPVNESVEDESDTSNDQIKKDESNKIDDSIPQNLVKPEVDDIIKLGSNIDGLPDGESPILKVEDISIEEGDIGTSIAQFNVNLSSPATKEIQFSYQTVDGSAISTSDYDPISGQITIPVGETSTNIDVEVNGDSEVELNEEFTLNLFGLSGATFENNKAEYSKVATIENDDIAQNAVESTQVPDDGSIFDGNLLDLKSFAGDITVTFTVDREAEFDNTVSFYKIEDTEGTITDPVTGNRLKPSDGEAYAELAMKLKEPQIELSVDNLNSVTIQDTLDGGYFYAPFIVADGNLDDGFSQVYFSFAQANSDKFEHIRSLGNTLRFEDLANGGDRDFNDMVIRAEITI